MKNMKKFVSLLLAVVMVMAMTMTTFAAETKSALTIATKAGHTYEVYQMLVGDVSGLTEGENGTNGATLANVTKGANLDGTVAEFDAAIKDDDGNYLTGADLGDAAAAKITGTPISVVGDGNVKSVNEVEGETGVTDGYYVIIDTWTDPSTPNKKEQLSRYMVTVVGDTAVTPKDDTNDIDKKIVDTDKNEAIDGDNKKTDTAAIGDVINYEITGKVPNHAGYTYYQYAVRDTMSVGLTFDPESVIVKVNGTAISDSEYTLLTESDAAPYTFVLAFKNIMDYTIGQDISITYNATVNAEAETGYDANTNTSHLVFSNNPGDSAKPDRDDYEVPKPGDVTGQTPDHVTKTYVTELTINKIDGDTKTFIDALKDAEFTLTGNGINDVVLTSGTRYVKATGDEAVYYLLNDGTYTTEAPQNDPEKDGYNGDKYAELTPGYKLETYVDVSNKDSGEEVNITAQVGDDGTITFKGLNAGSYKIEETKVPTGYNKAADIEFTITATCDAPETVQLQGVAIQWSSTNEDVSEQLNGEKKPLGTFETTIKNMKGNTLPSTGGMGTTIFYLIGTILVLGAGVLLVTKKRMA